MANEEEYRGYSYVPYNYSGGGDSFRKKGQPFTHTIHSQTENTLNSWRDELRDKEAGIIDKKKDICRRKETICKRQRRMDKRLEKRTRKNR